MKAPLVILTLGARFAVASAAGRGIFLRHNLQLLATPPPATVPGDVDATPDSAESVVAAAEQQDQATDTPSAADAVASEAPPTLPAISAMMGTAAATLKGISTQASALEARIAQTQMENEAKMARQKSVFEEKLAAQHRKNSDVVAANAKITNEIEGLKNGNDELKKRAKVLQEDNKFKRNELRTLKTKLSTVDDFLKSSLKDTDDTDAQQLAILQAHKVVHKAEPKKPMFVAKKVAVEKVAVEKVAVEKKEITEKNEQKDEKKTDADVDSDDDEEDDDDSDDDAASFMQVKATESRISSDDTEDLQLAQMDVEAAMGTPARPTTNANPRDILNVLSSGLDSLSAQEKQSESQLKSLFLANFKAGSKTHGTLIAQQKSLNATRATLLDTQSKLQEANAYLDSARDNVEQRLHKVGGFMQALAAFAIAPAGKAQELAKTLPDGSALQVVTSDASAAIEA